VSPDAVAVCVMTILGASFIAALVWLIVHTAQRRRANLEAAAAKWKGRVEEGFFSHALRFDVDGAPARLTFFSGGKNAPPWTKLQFDWASDVRLHVAPEGLFTSLRKLFGAEDLHTGDAAFDEAFLVQCSPPKRVTSVLGAGVRAALMDLRQLGAGFFNSGVRLDLTATNLTIHCAGRSFVNDRDQLLRFIELAVATLRGLRGAGLGARIAVREIVDSGRCPVCAGDLDGALRPCGSCGARYHDDCWAYLGGCAVFGCGQGYKRRERVRG
jgi:hypothetical protein